MIKPVIIAWDIEDTLVPKSERKSQIGNQVVRSNALELLAQAPVINLASGVLPVLKASRKLEIPNGIISSFAYQFGINLLTASPAREYINPRLIELGHKYAWEGMMLDGKGYDETLAQWVKPSTRMFESLLKKASQLIGTDIDPKNCLYIGDNEKDEETSRRAGWQYQNITNIDSVLQLL